jgi:beta-lactamase regulating signal transducer with metallopeptidase domain/HEAT repeat protein/protein involved in polysaccharide export with SLBB domain
MGAFAWLVSATVMGLALSALGAAAVWALREPARRVRAIEFTLLACLVAPWFPAVPGVPRVEWREWLAAIAPDDSPVDGSTDIAAISEPIAPINVPLAAEDTTSPLLVEAPDAPAIEAESELALSAVEPSATLIDQTQSNGAPIEASIVKSVKTPSSFASLPTFETAAVDLQTQVDDSRPEVQQVDWPVVFLSIYLAGTAIVLLLDALGGLALLRVWKASNQADANVLALFAEVAGQKHRRVSLLVSSRCRQPFTFAWLWPVIVLPPALVVRGKERELRWALAHEWSHIANRHTWGWALAGFTRAIYWPQPFVWLLRRRLRLEQDFIADAEAAGSSAGAPEYATFLTTQAAHAQRLSLGLGIAGGKSELARRVVMLVQGKRPVSARCGWTWSLCLCALLTAAAMGAASLAQGPLRKEAPPVAAKDASLGEPQESENAAPSDSSASPRSEALTKAQAADNDQRIQPFDLLSIHIVDVPYSGARSQTQTYEFVLGPMPQSNSIKVLTFVESNGQALIDARLGRVPLAGLTFAEAEQRVRERAQAAIQEDMTSGRTKVAKFEPAVQIVRQGQAEFRTRTIFVDDAKVIKAGDTISVSAGGPQIADLAIDARPIQVETTGVAPFGPRLGRIHVAGLTRQQAMERVRARVLEVVPTLRDGTAPPVAKIHLMVEGWRPKFEHQMLPRPAADLRIAPGDTLMIDVIDSTLRRRVLGYFRVVADGEVNLARETPGAAAGVDQRVKVAGKSLAEAEAAIREQFASKEDAQWVSVAYGDWNEGQHESIAAKTAVPRPNLRYSGKSFDEWREVLENDLDPATRVEALRALGKFGGNGMAKEAAEAIVPYIGFRDGDENVVYSTALEEMGKIGEPALPIVVAAFESPDVKIREAAGHLLTQMPANEAAIVALAKALDDKAPAVRIAAAGALGAKRQHLDRAGAVLDEAAKLGDEVLLRSIAGALVNYFPPTEERLQVVGTFLDSGPMQMQFLQINQASAKNSEFVALLMQNRLEKGMERLAKGDFAAQPGGHPDGDQMSGLFVDPLRALESLGPAAAPALPAILKLAEEPFALNHLYQHIVQVVRAIGPTAEPTARPVLERLRDRSASSRFYVDDLLRSWDAAAGRQSVVQSAVPAQPTSVQPAAVRPIPVQPAPAQPTPAQPNPTTTIYAGKTFHQWRKILEQDLDPSTRATAIAALAKFGANGMAKEAAEAIVPFIGLRTGDEQVVYSVAVESLRQLGPPTMPVVIEALANPDERIRKSAAYLLSELPAEPAVLAALDQALDDKSPAVRVSVAEALAAHKRDLDRAGQALEQVYKQSDAEAQQEIAEVLMRRFPPTDARLRIANDYLDRADSRKVQQHFNLGSTKNTEFMVPLMALRLEKALAALPPERGDLAGRRATVDLNRMNEQFVRPLLFLQRAGKKAIPALPTVLKLTERADLASHLGGYVLQVLRSMGPEAAKQAQPALERLRALPSENRRGEIDDLLRTWGEPPAEAEAKPQDAQPEKAAEKSAEIIRQYAGKSFEQWREVLEKDLDPAVQLEAIAAIKEFGRNGRADEAVRVLMPLLSSQASTGKEGVAGASGKVLAELGAAAVPALLDVLKHGDDHTQSEAVRAFYYMGFQGDAAAVAAEALIEEAKQRTSQPNRLRTAVHAIAKIHSRPAVTLPFLKEMAQSTDEDTRLGALLGLSTLKTTDKEVVPIIVESIWSFGGGGRRASFCHSALDWISERTSLPRKVEVVRGLLERAKKDLAGADLMLPALFSSAGKMGPAAASLVPLMVEISKQDPNSKAYLQTFADALEQIGPAAKEALPYLNSLRDRQPPGVRDHVGDAIMAIESAK